MTYAVGSCLAHEWAGYVYEGHLRGLHEPTEVGFVAVAEGFSPTVPARPPNSCQLKHI